jgi:membrane-bound lytic murein transglycosylase D
MYNESKIQCFSAFYQSIQSELILKRNDIIALALGLSVLLSGCTTIMPSTDSAEMASPPTTGMTADILPPSYVDIEENVYQNSNGHDATAETDDRAMPISSSGDTSKADSDNSPKTAQSKLDDALEFCRDSQEYWQRGELEKAVDALDQAYLLILEVEPQDDFKLIQEKEDLRFMISKRILEIYASRNIVVNGNHNAIPLDMNRHVEAEIKRFTVGVEKKFFLRSLVRSGRYRPQIVAELKEAGLPEELSWLPLIESGYNVKALSRARALGLWQFIPSTGYKFGLKRDRFIDERMDPEKSTRAAIAYLKELHNIFGDWTTVLAAYNCGEGRVLRVIKTQNVNYLDNFWDLYERLPRETARYVPRFLATLHILNAPEKYGLDLAQIDPPLNYETVTIDRQIHLRDAAKIIDVPESTLREMNPELRYKILPPTPYALKVPVGTSEVLLAEINNVRTTSLPQPAYVYHRVRSGETLSTIARHYRTSVARIQRANNLRGTLIRAGKRLKIPSKGYTYTKQPARAQKGPAKMPAYHMVRRGDSLWIIARRYGTTVKSIQNLNGLTGTRLYKGQKLKIAANPTPAPKVDGMKTYQVQSGDSPFKIAQAHQMPLDRFLRINRLSSRSTIYPGQSVYVE